MQLVDHHIDLEGPGCRGQYALPELVGGVLTRVRPMVIQTVRMSVLRTSRRVGRPIKELQSAWEVLHGGQEKGPDGSTRLLFRLPTLGAAAPRLFEQGFLWNDGPKPDDTAFDLIGGMLADIRERKTESERFDSDLLGRVAGFDSILGRGLNRLTLGGHHLTKGHRETIDPLLTETAKSLVSETPRPRRVRISGTLDMIRVSDRVFELMLDQGERLRAVWTGQTVITLAEYLNKAVVIEGDAVFRPSGGLLRVDTTAIAPARKEDALFTKLPVPLGRSLNGAVLRQRQTETTGVNAIWGRWPKEGTEEELMQAVEELS
ncbi:MAG TPA: hypothetical protein PKE29_13595 [Phycisphaerales bacterium]|nr:hypothetical protein [Phycisphaerales bacterium]